MKNDKELIRLLKVEYIAHPIVNTSKGLLSKVLRKGEDQYFLTLDAVPLSEELSKQIYENIQSEQKGDAPRAQTYNPPIEEARVEVRSIEASEGTETNQEEITSGTTAVLSQSPVEDLDRELAKEVVITAATNKEEIIQIEPETNGGGTN